MQNALAKPQCACTSSALRAPVRVPRPVSSSRSSSSSSRSMSTLHQQQRSRLLRVQATGAGGPAPKLNDSSNGQQATIKDTDLSFIGKLVVVSAVGAVVIKYGSLLISLPFEPSPAVALGVVLGTPALYSLFLLTQSGQQQQQ